MRQLLYVSTAVPSGAHVPVEPILEASRHNNALDGVTGLLWTDSKRFLQVIEGDEEAVETTFARIMADPRHENIQVLIDRAIDAREFGSWTMTHRRPGDTSDEFETRVLRLLQDASPAIRDAFVDLIGG